MSDWDEAIAEAYVSAAPEDVVLSTLELRHPSFVNELGEVTPVRIVRDPGELLSSEDFEIYGFMCTLEDDAPVNPGEEVLFQSCMFNFSFPEQTQTKLPDINLEIANVTRLVSQYLDNAVEGRDVVQVTYREFIYTDRSSPKIVFTGLTMTRVKSTIFKVTGTAGFRDLINKSFPRKIYRPEDYRGLIGV